MERIFIQIASYRDPECPRTVADIFHKAKHPERVFIGICNQVDLDNDRDCVTELNPFPGQVREILFPAIESKGVCWARHQAEKLYRGEEYFLMIDSHMRFIEAWDELFIRELKVCPSQKAILSHYPAAYTPPDRVNVMDNAIVMTATPFNRMGDLRFSSRVLKAPTDKPLRGAFIAAACLFASADLLSEVPYDPYLYFAQEEIAMSVRLFTHGWDVFSPRTNMIYHMYLQPGEAGNRRLHWEDHRDWLRLASAGRRRLEYLLTARTDGNSEDHLVDIQRYGLGTVRTLKEFEEFVGIDFAMRQTSQKALDGTFIENIDRYI